MSTWSILFRNFILFFGPVKLMQFTTLINIYDFMQSEEQIKQVKTLLHQRLRYLYKKMYKQCS